jgi:Eukaryotic aspartyl protease
MEFEKDSRFVSLVSIEPIESYCVFLLTSFVGVSDAGDSTSVLGDTFLRSAYVVYDIANNQISLAQTNFNATSSNVKEIAAGASGVPNAASVTGAVTTLSVSTGGVRSPQVSTISSAPSVSSSTKVMIVSVMGAILALAFAI